MSTEFEDQPTTVVPAAVVQAATAPAAPAPVKSMAAWAEDKGHMHVRKAMRNGDKAVRKPAPHVFGAASLIHSDRGIRDLSHENIAAFHAALMGTVVTEAEYDVAVVSFNSIVLR